MLSLVMAVVMDTFEDPSMATQPVTGPVNWRVRAIAHRLALPTMLPVIVLATKSPLASLETIALTTFVLEALMFHVVSA
jgi:hypothetical protein